MATGNKKALIIDDDEPIRDHLRHMLEKSGYEVHEASNGTEGMNCLSFHSYDIVFTDLVMPEKEGIETICEIRSLHPDCKVIAVSGSVYLSMAKALGAHATISKPFTKYDVDKAIANVYNQSENGEKT
ncbi:MAG: response regulator [Chitinivibrionales bacterium]